jgi:hypothetical protein
MERVAWLPKDGIDDRRTCKGSKQRDRVFTMENTKHKEKRVANEPCQNGIKRGLEEKTRGIMQNKIK